MRTFYLDTSSFLNLALQQAHEQAAVRCIQQAQEEGGALVSSELLRLEARRTYFRDQQAWSWTTVENLLHGVGVFRVTDQDWEQAYGLVSGAKSLDALHIGAALRMGSAGFITSDKGQATAALSAGIRVLWAQSQTLT